MTVEIKQDEKEEVEVSKKEIICEEVEVIQEIQKKIAVEGHVTQKEDTVELSEEANDVSEVTHAEEKEATEEADMTQMEEAEATQKNIPDEVEVDKVDDISDEKQDKVLTEEEKEVEKKEKVEVENNVTNEDEDENVDVVVEKKQ